MKNRTKWARTSRALAVCGLCCVAKISVAQNTAPQTQTGQDQAQNSERAAFQAKLDALENASGEGRRQLFSALATDQRRNTEFMTLLFKMDSSDNQVRCMAAYLLGQGRYAQAARELSKQITLTDRTPVPFGTRPSFGLLHPAAVALANIGKPSTFWMLANLESSDEGATREWSLRVIQAVEGAEVGTFILERAAAKQNDSVKKARLRVAIEALPKLVGGVRPEWEQIFSSP